MSIWRLTALGIATLLLTFAGSISPNVVSAQPAQQTSVCATGGAVPNPDANPGLVSDCETLLAARDTLAGTVALNWAANTPMLEWDGVSYQGTPERVTRLELDLMGLTGEIPTELGSLSNLEALWLDDNELTGEIPTELGNLSNLEALWLDDNELTGEIPTELGNLSNLQQLGLDGNQLTGELPHSLTGLTVLMGFTFHNNSGLCAPVDEAFQTWLQSVSSVRGSSCAPMDSAEDRAALVELYNATGGANWTNNTNWLSDRPIREWYGVSNDPDGRVSQLLLYDNKLTGEIPTELGSLSNLERLDLGWNQLTGDIPTELGSLSNLEALWLDDNELTGEIPTELGNLSNLQGLLLWGNQLTGEIPTELGNLSNLQGLWLDGNQLTGELPHSLTGLTVLAEFTFHSNSGLCAPVDEAFQTWLQSVSSVRGSSCAPMDSAEDRAALVEFYNATGGASWTNNTNWLSDRPIREWYGVSNDPDGRVSQLWLNDNELTGEIPTELGSLSNLETLDLGGNQLTGDIPAELGNLSNLAWLYLSGNQLTGCVPAGLWDVPNNDFDQLGMPFCELESPGVPSVSFATPVTPVVRLNSPIAVTVTFSESIFGFTIEDVGVVNGAASNFEGSDGDTVFSFDVTPNTIGPVTVDIAAGVAQDADSHENMEAVQLSLGMPYDDDHDGAIGSAEVLQAVRDYFAQKITGPEVLEVVRLYFSKTAAPTLTPTPTPTPTPAPTATPTPTPTPAGPTIIPLGLAPPVPGSCGDGSYDTPVPVTGLLGGNKSPSWRSDCAEIAYVQNAGVSVMKRDGEHLRDLYRYEHGGSVAASAANWTAWSPDGTRLALAVENSGSGDPYWARHIWVVEADGSNMVQLTSGPEWDNSPSWSPDGNQIVFQRAFTEGGSQIVTIDVDGSNETPLTAGSTEEYVPSWSPDGANIGYVTEYGQLALMAPDGSNRREIVANHAVGGILGGMSWSPDSSQIAYTRDLGECIGIVLINADGTDERRISHLPGDSRQPAWSPDGELLLFVNTIARGTGQIYIVSVHGGSRHGLEEGCAQVERYEPNQDVAAPYDWHSRFPQEAAPASALECRPLDPRGGLTAGFPRPAWVPSVGKLRIAVLFVDFPDGVADYSTREEAEHDEYTFGRTNLAAIEEYLETASYGKLDVEMVPLHGWLRARHSLTAFFTEAGRVSEDISVEAVELALAEMDFSEIDVVVTVLPSAYFFGGLFAGAVQISDKLIPTLHIGLIPNHVINDTAGPWGFTGAHELAHALGLTDLYPKNYFDIPSPPADMQWIGVEAGLMGLQGRYLAPRSATRGFGYGQTPYAMLAWSRWQLGWLEPAQIRCIVEPSATVTLTAIDQPGDGVAMIAVPVGETEVIVIESRRDRGYDALQLTGYDRDVVNNDGVLVYTVDSSLRELPIRFATDGGEGIMDQSPILPVGTSITVKGYEITVVEDTGDTHTVRVSKLDGGN